MPENEKPQHTAEKPDAPETKKKKLPEAEKDQEGQKREPGYDEA